MSVGMSATLPITKNSTNTYRPKTRNYQLSTD